MLKEDLKNFTNLNIFYNTKLSLKIDNLKFLMN